jgi:membrane-bound ClpP family serine protease
LQGRHAAYFTAGSRNFQGTVSDADTFNNGSHAFETRSDSALAQARPGRTPVPHREPSFQEQIMTLGTILLIILILILIGALPTWSYSRNWGYGPSGIGGVLVLILIILLLTGRL